MELITQMLEELCALSTEISNDDVEMLCTEIRGARRVYLAGRGPIWSDFEDVYYALDASWPRSLRS